MNEKLRQLAEQAGIATYYPAGIAERLEKFAQLLVFECVNAWVITGIVLKYWCSNVILLFDIYQLAFEELTELSRAETLVVKYGVSTGA